MVYLQKGRHEQKIASEHNNVHVGGYVFRRILFLLYAI